MGSELLFMTSFLWVEIGVIESRLIRAAVFGHTAIELCAGLAGDDDLGVRVCRWCGKRGQRREQQGGEDGMLLKLSVMAGLPAGG